jgi:lipopolysaccharide exporter
VEGSRAPLTKIVARGAIINAGATLIAGGLFAIRNLVAASLMAPETLAVWTIAGVILVTAMSLRGVGVVERFVADRDRPAREAFNDAFSVGLLFSALVAVIVALLAPLFTVVYDDSRMLLPIIAVAGLILMDGLKFPIWWHYRELRFGTQRALMLADAGGSVIFAIPLLAIGWDYWGLIAGAGIASVCSIIFAWAISPHPRATIPTRETIRRYTSFGGPVLGFAVVAIAGGHLAYLAVRHSSGLEALGWLAVAGFPFIVAERLVAVLNQSIYPALVRRGQESRERATELMQRMVWALLAPGLFLIAAVAPWLVPAGLGHDYENAGWLMSVVAIGSLIREFGFAFSVIIMSTGNTRALGRFAVLYLVAALVIVIPGTLAWGMVGYAATLPVVELMFASERWRILRRLLPTVNLFRDAAVDLSVALLPALGALAGLLLTDGESWGFRLTFAALLALEGVLVLIWHYWPLARQLLAAVRHGQLGARERTEQPAPIVTAAAAPI